MNSSLTENIGCDSSDCPLLPWDETPGPFPKSGEEFPHLSYGSKKDYLKAWGLIDSIFTVYKKKRVIANLKGLGASFKGMFQGLEPYFSRINEKKCSHCKNHCCINSHGFPDFEDLVLRRSMDLPLLEYDFRASEGADCQFLTSSGCRLPRYERSYRCSWYLCSKVTGYFEKRDCEGFHRFERKFFKLSQSRQVLLYLFKLNFFQILRRLDNEVS